jgi:hypothetical protein
MVRRRTQKLGQQRLISSLIAVLQTEDVSLMKLNSVTVACFDFKNYRLIIGCINIVNCSYKQ